MPDYSSAPNCSRDATFIDIYQKSIQKNTQRSTEHENDMKKIRRKFVCSKCRKYPGDDQWSFGTWDNGPYICFDCT